MDPLEKFMNSKHFRKYILIAVLAFVIAICIFSASFIIPPGNRGVLVTMGKGS